MLDRFEQLTNVLSSIAVKLLGIVILSKLLQYSKALEPI